MNPCSVPESEWLRYAPLLLTIAGWYFVNLQSNRRETRKEHRALLDITKKQVSEICANALKYLQDSDSKLAPEIKWALSSVEIEFCRLPGYGKSSPLLARYVSFVDACTSGDFEQIERLAESIDSPRSQAIVEARNALLESMESWFSSEYVQSIKLIGR
jgi:hypothetical protein